MHFLFERAQIWGTVLVRYSESINLYSKEIMVHVVLVGLE